MTLSKKLLLITGVLIVAGAIGFQNCAKTKFVDPDHRHTLLAMGLCQLCDDDSGSGIQCRQSEAGSFASCAYESCLPGYKLVGDKCVAVTCEAGAIAGCSVTNGEGRMTCASTGQGYSSCSAINCDVGFVLQDNNCVKVETVCAANSHRDCSTVTTMGVETCRADGSGYDACVLGDCRSGYVKNDAGECVAVVCEANTVTPCTIGVGTGFQRCNSQGTAWLSCEINGCQSGYVLQDGVCQVQVCSPGTTTTCEFSHGTGEKTCNETGMDYGACTLLDCQAGYTAQDGQCVEQVCSPGSTATCLGESGSGTKICNANGMGYGSCTLTSCDPGFKLKSGQCVRAHSCDIGEKYECSIQNGKGERTCVDGHMLGPCVAKECKDGYRLVNEGNSPTCKKISNGKKGSRD
jgi:hypothetical protein